MRLFPMNLGQARARMVQAGAALLAAALIAGCGSTYRAVVTPIYSTGPMPQPTAHAVAISVPSTSAAGIATIIDYSGDSIMAQAPIGIGPVAFTLDQSGSTGYTLNSDGTLTNFPVSVTLQAKNITYSTLSNTAQPIGLFSPAGGLWAADLAGNYVDVFTGSPESFNVAIPVAPTPVMVLGVPSIGQRNFSISQGNSQGGKVASGVTCNAVPFASSNGEADGIEIATDTVSSHLPLGNCPVYGVQSSDGRRIFVLNRGDDTISVINAQNNTLDSCTPFTNQAGQTVNCHPKLPLSTTAVRATGIAPPNGTAGMTAIAGPVYAEYNNATSQLVVANYDGGTISIIDVSMDEYGNDGPTFGTTYTVPVGNNPAGVTVLYDGSRAYTANQADGTVSIVTLASHTIEKTLSVVGPPRNVVSVQNSEYGKVYVVSPDSPFITVLSTNTDLVDTTILVEGNVLDLRTTNQNGSGGNVINNSRKAGYGQPCYLPGAANAATLAACQNWPNN
jgi:DNA-binding beta-propeller fold protein YncE